jgi:deoxyhypusine synthase (EC 2.5.1.46)
VASGFGLEPIRDVRVSGDMRVCDLVEAYRAIHGFTASRIWEAVRVLREGLSVSDVRILSFTGNLVATGLRGVISQLVGRRLFNLVVTTTGALDHDIARSLGGVYYKGFFEADDVELGERGVYRLGNVYIPSESYGPLIEMFVRKLVGEISSVKSEWGVYELLRRAGAMIEDENSILRSASIAGVDVIVPGWPDGAFGTALFMEAQRGVGVKVNYFHDMMRLSDIFFTAKKATALVLGGGISKHHTLWWSQFKGGLDYAVYVTTAVEYDGSLSGAQTREAISWGKISKEANHVVVYGDVTVILPIIACCILEVKPQT